MEVVCVYGMMFFSMMVVGFIFVMMVRKVMIRWLILGCVLVCELLCWVLLV